MNEYKSNLELTKSEYEKSIERSKIITAKSHDFVTAHKADALIKLISRYADPADLDVLDVGCGVGLTDKHLEGKFKRLVGTDTSSTSILDAQTFVTGAEYVQCSPSHLPFRDGEFDVAFAICVVHHVPPDQRLKFFNECKRVLKPNGLFVVFEHNPINPLTQVIVKTCALDTGVKLLGPKKTFASMQAAGFRPLCSEYILITPFKNKLFRLIDTWLARVPLGTQYYCAGRAE